MACDAQVDDAGIACHEIDVKDALHGVGLWH
jgi:hypothetical protein